MSGRLRTDTRSMWCRALALQTAALLTELRDEGLLTVDVLQTMPLDVARFAPDTMLRPLFDSVRAALRQDPLIPTAMGGYGSSGELKLANGTLLPELLNPDQLGALYGAAEPVAFGAESITESLTPELWLYLQAEIGIEGITPAAVLGRVTAEFLQAQSDAWISRFYAFLDQNSALWKAPGFAGDQPGLARTKPILRLEDGSQVPPFGADGRPAVYLPGPIETSLPTVRRAIAERPDCRRFLAALGITEPDVVAEVLDDVLPRYHRLDIADLDAAQRDADLECVARALAEAPAGRRLQLLERLQQTAFLIGEDAATRERRLMTPTSLYPRSRQLEIY